jgi:hypothetical protein
MVTIKAIEVIGDVVGQHSSAKLAQVLTLLLLHALQQHCQPD